ncbi:hypothetical protein ACFPPA_17240 [Rhodanobacter ginsengisoli]|uniref:Glycosyl hydrolase family 95 catalytic domain-containing protein n=1 Tax=Rhodanobacter ginsengisoli TaxID=418646 RepID=A0ABW0QR89_9GAMM
MEWTGFGCRFRDGWHRIVDRADGSAGRAVKVRQAPGCNCYLLISSSRRGGPPANCLWAEGAGTPWNGDHHTNVYTEMNYWPAEATGLGELVQPLFALTASLPAAWSQGEASGLHARGAFG